jgi:hypothetical protein
MKVSIDFCRNQFIIHVYSLIKIVVQIKTERFILSTYLLVSARTETHGSLCQNIQSLFETYFLSLRTYILPGYSHQKISSDLWHWLVYILITVQCFHVTSNRLSYSITTIERWSVIWYFCLFLLSFHLGVLVVKPYTVVNRLNDEQENSSSEHTIELLIKHYTDRIMTPMLQKLNIGIKINIFS